MKNILILNHTTSGDADASRCVPFDTNCILKKLEKKPSSLFVFYLRKLLWKLNFVIICKLQNDSVLMNEENKTKLLTALSTREQKHPPTHTFTWKQAALQINCSTQSATINQLCSQLRMIGGKTCLETLHLLLQSEGRPQVSKNTTVY